MPYSYNFGVGGPTKQVCIPALARGLNRVGPIPWLDPYSFKWWPSLGFWPGEFCLFPVDCYFPFTVNWDPDELEFVRLVSPGYVALTE